MSAEDKIAAIGGANGLDKDSASTLTSQIQTHIDEADKIQEQITKAFSEGQKKVDTKKAETGFNQAVSGFNYDKSDSDALSRLEELAGVAKGNNSVEVYSNNIEQQVQLVDKMAEKKKKYVESLKDAKAKNEEFKKAKAEETKN